MKHRSAIGLLATLALLMSSSVGAVASASDPSPTPVPIPGSGLFQTPPGTATKVCSPSGKVTVGTTVTCIVRVSSGTWYPEPITITAGGATIVSASAGGGAFLFHPPMTATVSGTSITLSAPGSSAFIVGRQLPLGQPDPGDIIVTETLLAAAPGTLAETITSGGATPISLPPQSPVIFVAPDTTPPIVSCSVAPSQLWPPNGKLVSVHVTVSVTDPGGSGPNGFKLVSITTNNGNIADEQQGFVVGTASTSGKLRAARNDDKETSRIYTLTYQGSDVTGNTANCAVTVTVPHDRGH